MSNYRHCALDGCEYPDSKKRTWCGKISSNTEFVFQDANHALLTGKIGSRLLLCLKCYKEMSKALESMDLTNE
jgi:hypothetical protein